MYYVAILTHKSGDMIDQQLAIALFDYDPETGSLTWRLSTNSFKKGEEAGSVSGAHGYTDYRNVVVFGDRYKAHRLIWLMRTGSWPSGHIDHMDGNGLNNKWDNLREATPSQNAMNQKVRSDSASGCKGISYDKRRDMWYAYIDIDGSRVHLGRHENKDEAVAVRLAAEKRYHGEYARSA